MFFGRAIIKLLRQTNSRLRADLRDRDRTIKELLDKFVHQRTPERLTQARIANPEMAVTQGPNDAYSAAIEDADRLADLARSRTIGGE
jgi:hypothetical protein